MTLDEAIIHAKEKAEELKMQADFDTDNEGFKMSITDRLECYECASEHKQLAEWLKELKAVREAWLQLTETIFEMRDNGGTGTQADVCKFLANYMSVLEKEIMEAKEVKE